MKIAEEVTIPINSGKSFIVKKGECICVLGESIVDDTYAGRHDLQYGTCSKTFYDLWWQKLRNTEAFKNDFAEWGVNSREDLSDHGCWENIANALNDYDIIPEDIPSPFNLFQSLDIDADGKFLWRIDDHHLK